MAASMLASIGSGLLIATRGSSEPQPLLALVPPASPSAKEAGWSWTPLKFMRQIENARWMSSDFRDGF